MFAWRANCRSKAACEPAPADGAAPAALRGPARVLFGQALDLNTSDPLTLQVLPGIGPRRAAAIVEARSAEPLRAVSDLQRVHGIGPRTVERLAGWVEVGGPDE